MIRSTGPSDSTGRPTLVLSEVQTRSHKYETERHETHYSQVCHHWSFLSESDRA